MCRSSERLHDDRSSAWRHATDDRFRDRAGPAPARRFPLRDGPRGRRSPGLPRCRGACADSRAKLDATIQFAVLPVAPPPAPPPAPAPARVPPAPAVVPVAVPPTPLAPPPAPATPALAVVPAAVLLSPPVVTPPTPPSPPAVTPPATGPAIPATTNLSATPDPTQAAARPARPRGAGAMTGPRVAMAASQQLPPPQVWRRSSAVSLARHSAHPAEVAVRERPAVAVPRRAVALLVQTTQTAAPLRAALRPRERRQAVALPAPAARTAQTGGRRRPVRRPQERRRPEGRLLAARPRRPGGRCHCFVRRKFCIVSQRRPGRWQQQWQWPWQRKWQRRKREWQWERQ